MIYYYALQIVFYVSLCMNVLLLMLLGFLLGHKQCDNCRLSSARLKEIDKDDTEYHNKKKPYKKGKNESRIISPSRVERVKSFFSDFE